MDVDQQQTILVREVTAMVSSIVTPYRTPVAPPTGDSHIKRFVITWSPFVMRGSPDPALPPTEGLRDSYSAGTETVPVKLCGSVSGRMELEADIDCYAFDAKKDEQISVEVLARRNGSALDPIVRILNDKGAQLVENDDMRQWGRRTIQDSMIENWKVPADGRYTIEVRDVHLRGGAEFVYGLEVTRATPQFELVMDTDKSWLTPGSCATLFVRIVRLNGFTGEVQLQLEGLPEGVTAIIPLRCTPSRLGNRQTFAMSNWVRPRSHSSRANR